VSTLRFRFVVLAILIMIGPNLSIADWNTRGLNDQGRKDTVHAFLADTLCHIACIQETKIDHLDQ
jgi:hypothetical protein